VVNKYSLKNVTNKFQLFLKNKQDLTHSYIQKWRERCNNKNYVICGSASSSDYNSYDGWVEKKSILPTLLKKHGSQNIFNIDETG
jgi:hypothetical protein